MPDGQIKTEDGTTPSTEPEGLVVRYRYGEGILLQGDTYPHKDAIKKAIPRWRWFRSMQQWGVTATRDRAMTQQAVQRYADGLTKAGLSGVRVDYVAPKPEDVRPAAELFEERQRRSRERAEAASQRAARLEQQATSHYEASHDAVRHIPMGQPILVGHHSQRKHERAVERAHAAMGRSVRAQQDAERAHAQARGSEAQAAARESPSFAIRRLRELTAEARELDVRLTGEAPPDWRGFAPREPATGDERSMLLTRQREVQERIDYFRSLLEEAHVPAMQTAPRPMELVVTERGEEITVKTTPKMVKVKRGGGVISVARDWVWLPKAILALRDEHPLTRDEVLMLWKAQHEGSTRASSPEQHEALELLVEMGLMVPHPDMKNAGIYLATNRGKAIELPEGKPRTWLKRWDGLRVTPAPEDQRKRRHAPPKPSAEPKSGTKPESSAKTGSRSEAGPQAEPQPRMKTAADADRLAERLGLEPTRTPTIGRMREAMVHAVREGLGPQMKAWFVQHTRALIGDIDAAFGYGRGVVALENGGWPPSPLRGKSYGEEHFRGLVHSLEHLPEVVELLDAALSWDGDMTEATGGRHSHWFDDGRIADLARRIMSDLHLERVSRPNQRTPQRAEELREWVRRSALRQLARLRIPLDPSLYDPQADPEVVYRKVCEVDSEAARKILDEVFGVEFQPGTDGNVDAADLCDGKKTLDDIRADAVERAAATAKEDAERTTARRQDAEALIEVADVAAKRGPITARRFNDAYWRLHPELQAERKRRALMVRRKGSRTEASVHGPGDQRFFVSVQGDHENALAALMRMLVEATGESINWVTTEELVHGAPAAANERPTSAASSTEGRKTHTSTAKRRAEAGSAERAVRAILTTRLAEDGPNGVSEFSTEHEPSMVRAARRMAKRGEVTLLKSPRGRVRIAAGPKWEPVAPSPQTVEPMPAKMTSTELEPAPSEPLPSSSSPPPEHAPGSLWSVEQEGFALVSPRGEGQRVQVPIAVQPMLLDVGKPDRETMERLRERELAERRRPAKVEAPAPLLEAAPPPDRWPSGQASTPIREDAPLPEGFPIYGPDDSVSYGPKYAAYMAHHGQTDPEAMMGHDTARYPNPLEGYLQWLREHPTEAETGQAELEAEAKTEPTARLEYVDVATGAPSDPSELGTLSTGRVVAEIDGEMVEIDEEDLLGHGSDPDPRKRRYRFDADSPADYPGQAKAKKTARASKKGVTKARAKAKAGLRATFDSATKAAALFYEHNADFFDHVRDPWDGLRDWMDGIEVRAGRGKGHRKLARTEAGKRILRQKHAAVAIRQTLAYLMGKAKGRRWEDVPWEQVDRLGEALARYYEAPDREAGQPGIYWRPFTGTVRVEDLDAMTPEQREAIRAREATQEIGEQLEQLREAYVRAKGCLPKEVRQVVERRIVEWTRWVKDPTQIPGYACEPDPATAGYLCNYPSVAGELAQLRRSCEDAYDPNWAAEPSKQGAAGFPDTSGGEDELPPSVGASARACYSRTLETPEPAKPVPTTPAGAPPSRAGARADRSSAGPAPPRAAPKRPGRKAKAPSPRPKTPVNKGQARSTRTNAPSTKAKGRSRPAARRENPKVLAAQRRAQRLACSADAARHQADTIDTASYAARLQAAKEAVKEAERLNKTRIKELEAAKKHHAAVRVDADAEPKELALARRQAHEARCSLQLARSVLAQRKRDHARAITELRRAEQRVKGRKAVADRRERIAKQAMAQAEALTRRA